MFCSLALGREEVDQGGGGGGGGGLRVGGVGFKNCIRQVSDRALRSFKEALKELLPDT